jgi:hypothetical protein
MPILENPRHEIFAQGLARGSSAAAAYVEAGYQNAPKDVGLREWAGCPDACRETEASCVGSAAVPLQGSVEAFDQS